MWWVISRLMGRDETGTLARLREHRQQRLEPVLARHGGWLVKLSGDGALVPVGNGRGNKEQSADTAIVFRIGLHLGDLIVDGDDLSAMA